jgi:iron complex transport system substrate-binding protein
MFRKVLLITAMVLVSLAACTSAPGETLSESELMEFTDDLGRTIELPGYPQAIVSLSPSTTEILFAIGAGEQVVGRDDVSLYPAEAQEVTSVGSLWGELPAEAILALEPDLVLVGEIISEEQVQALADLGLTVYWQANPLDFQGLYDNLMEIASLTGSQAQAEALVAELSNRVAALQDTLTGAGWTPSVFYELDATDPTNPWTAGTGTFIDYLINSAGGVNAAADLQGDYVQISTEGLITANPDVILLGDALYGISPESVAGRPGWEVISAVQNGMIFPIDPNMMSVPGPRLVEALEETATILHPELFE